MSAAPNRNSGSAGFSLLEVMLAAVLVGLTLVSSTGALAEANQTKAMLADQSISGTGLLLAQEIFELAQRLPREPSGTTGVTSGADVVALDSLMGAVFSPPIRADGMPLTGRSGWTQRVDFTVHSLGGLAATAQDPASLGADKHANKIFEISVTVSHDNAETGTYRWWLSPAGEQP